MAIQPPSSPELAQLVHPGEFEPEHHFYPRVLNSQIHPVVRFLAQLGNRRICDRYCHLHPEVEPQAVTDALSYRPTYFRWGGCDLFHTTDEKGHRSVVVIETNSSPSGQKSVPFSHEPNEQGGYRTLLQRSFLPLLKRRSLPEGGLAVLYDKNWMEVSGYAAALADLTNEPVWLVPWYDGSEDAAARFNDQRVLEVRDPGTGEWHPIRAAFRYVTQRPWNRIPPQSKTAIFNPVVVDLAGGRNKMLAAKAYDFHNADLRGTGLEIRVPETIWDVEFREVPLWVERMGGIAVVKVPYSNAGQGVFTITNERELAAFMDSEFAYERFIVQGLIGNSGWSSRTSRGRMYHVGTVPNRRLQIFVADLRFMIGASPEGFFPIAIYARRSREPLVAELTPDSDSWAMLGTNLSVKQADGHWTTEPERLLLMDSRDFNHLGIGLDELIEAYIQTVLSVTAIDRMADRLVTKKGKFRRRLFRSLNPDPALSEEIWSGPDAGAP